MRKRRKYSDYLENVSFIFTFLYHQRYRPHNQDQHDQKSKCRLEAIAHSDLQKEDAIVKSK